MVGPANDQLIARETELARVERAVLEAESHSSLLWIVGVPGIGKTSLLRAATERAQRLGHLVIQARPTRVEQRMSFAALGDLVRDLDRSGLSDGRRVALEVALGLRLSESWEPLPHQLGMALVEMIEHTTRMTTVTVVVDDFQWFDSASREPFEFAMRRLPKAGVCVLIAHRAGHDSSGVLPPFIGHDDVVALTPLPDPAVMKLVRQSAPRPLEAHLIDRVVATAGGNPLYAIELARAAGDLRIRPGRPLALPASLAAVVEARLEALPPATRQACALAAMLARPTVDAISRLGELGALRPAELAGVVVVVNGEVRFSHPVLASAAHDAVVETDRLALHRRLAEVTDGVERLVHRALGSEQLDIVLSGELLTAAGDELARGAPHEAAELGTLALAATPSDHSTWPGTAVRAGELVFRVGRTDEAVELLESARGRTTDGAVLADALLMLATIEFSRSADGEVAARLARECLELATDDKARAKAHAILARCDHLDFEDAVRHSDEALSLMARQPGGDTILRASVLTAAAAARFAAGYGIDLAGLGEAIALEEGSDVIGADTAYATLAALLKYADEIEPSIEMFERLAADSDPSSVPYALGHLPQLYLWSGDWERADSTAELHRQLSDETGQSSQVEAAEFNLALIAAFRGRYDNALRIGGTLQQRGVEQGVPWTERLGVALLGFVAACRDDLEHAVTHFDRYDTLGEEMRLYEPGYHRFLGDHVECLVRTGRRERADAVLDRFDALATRVGRRSTRSAVERGRALCALHDGHHPAALNHARRAVNELAGTPLVYDHARALLVLGAVGRAAGERTVAREALEVAFTSFDRMGARHFAEVARREAARISGRTRVAPSGPGGLTDTESTVAALAAAGSTTRQIAATMHISPKTVEAHLTTVYRKLGVGNRAQLATRIRAIGATAESG